MTEIDTLWCTLKLFLILFLWLFYGSFVCKFFCKAFWITIVHNMLYKQSCIAWPFEKHLKLLQIKSPFLKKATKKQSTSNTEQTFLANIHLALLYPERRSISWFRESVFSVETSLNCSWNEIHYFFPLKTCAIFSARADKSTAAMGSHCANVFHPSVPREASVRRVPALSISSGKKRNQSKQKWICSQRDYRHWGWRRGFGGSWWIETRRRPFLLQGLCFLCFSGGVVNCDSDRFRLKHIRDELDHLFRRHVIQFSFNTQDSIMSIEKGHAELQEDTFFVKVVCLNTWDDDSNKFQYSLPS